MNFLMQIVLYLAIFSFDSITFATTSSNIIHKIPSNVCDNFAISLLANGLKFIKSKNFIIRSKGKV